MDLVGRDRSIRRLLFRRIFKQSRSAQPLLKHECVYRRQILGVTRNGKDYYSLKCHVCYAKPGIVDNWPAFHMWVNSNLVVQTGQSIKELFMAVRQDPIYTSTMKRTGVGKHKRNKRHDKDNEGDKDDGESLVLQPMAQPPASGKAHRRSAGSKKTS